MKCHPHDQGAFILLGPNVRVTKEKPQIVDFTNILIY